MTICHTMTFCLIPMTTCHTINKLTLIVITDRIRLTNDNTNVTV